jgi:hypothetical protein
MVAEKAKQASDPDMLNLQELLLPGTSPDFIES